MDRTWMINRGHCDRLQPKYLEGVEYFLDFAFKNKNEGVGLRCPCMNCNMALYLDRDTMWDHLMEYGILNDYDPWVFHGEESISDRVDGENDEVLGVGDSSTPDDLMRDDMVPLVHEAMNVKFSTNLENPNSSVGAEQNGESSEIPENVDRLLRSAEEDLYPGCKTFSKLEFMITLLHLKVSHRWSDKSFSMLLSALHRAFGFDGTFPKSSYEAKKYTKDLGLNYIKIDACKNHCILFRKEYAAYDVCPVCGCSRWKDLTLDKDESDSDGEISHKGSKVPQLVLRHFPITSRLQRMYMSSKLARNMRWHKESRLDNGILKHPADSMAWKFIDECYSFILTSDIFEGKGKRGRTRCIKWNNARKRTLGVKPSCQITKDMKRIVGDNADQFITELGHRIRTMLPIKCRWSVMDNDYKERLFNRIKAEWNLPEGHAQVVENQCKVLFRQWRYRLKEEFFTGYTIAEAIKNCPSYVDRDEWKWMCEKYWCTDHQKRVSQRNRENRSQQRVKATQGSKSTARILEMLRKTRQLSTTNQSTETPQESLEGENASLPSPPLLEPEYIVLWEKTKRHKDHSMDKFAEEKLEEFKQLHQTQLELHGADNLTIEEAYMKVLGTCSGYIRGLGFGPKPPKCMKYGTFSEENASFTQQMVDQFDNLEKASREREHQLNQQIQELQNDKNAMLEEMEKMKRDAEQREERMRSDFQEMLRQQLSSLRK